MLKLQKTTIIYSLVLTVLDSVLSTYVYYKEINRYCMPYYDCPPGNEILPCITDYSKDICAPCYKDHVQPELISSSPDGDTATTSCFKPTSVCIANDLTYNRVPRPAYCNSLDGCKCNTDKCYFGDPCLCERKYNGCGKNKTLDESGDCVPCPNGTVKDDTGCGPCYHRNRTSEKTVRSEASQIPNEEARVNYQILFILMIVLGVLSVLLCCMIARVCFVRFKENNSRREVTLTKLESGENNMLIKNKEGVENELEEIAFGHPSKVTAHLYPDLTNQTQGGDQVVENGHDGCTNPATTSTQPTAPSNLSCDLTNVILSSQLQAHFKAKILQRSISSYYDSSSSDSNRYDKNGNDDYTRSLSRSLSSTSSNRRSTMIHSRRSDDLTNNNTNISYTKHEPANQAEKERFISGNQASGGITANRNRNSVLMSTDSRLFADGISQDTSASITNLDSGSYMTMGVSENTSDITEQMTSTLEDYPFNINGHFTADMGGKSMAEKLKILNRLISSDSGVVV